MFNLWFAVFLVLLSDFALLMGVIRPLVFIRYNTTIKTAYKALKAWAWGMAFGIPLFAAARLIRYGDWSNRPDTNWLTITCFATELILLLSGLAVVFVGFVKADRHLNEE